MYINLTRDVLIIKKARMYAHRALYNVESKEKK